MSALRVFLLVSLALCSAATSKRGIVTVQGSLDDLNINFGTCPVYPNVLEGYREALDNFTIEAFKGIASLGAFQFVISPHSMWMTVAAMAEGADYYTRHHLFDLLHLPSNPCVRHEYYKLAASRYSFANDAAVVSNRVLVIDEGVTPNPVWHNFVAGNSLLNVLTAPIKYNPIAAASKIRQLVYANFPRLDLHGNSVLIDTVDYNGLWHTAFADAVVKRAPFYSLAGEIIGSVDLMTIRRRGRIGYVSLLKSKVLEIPIGENKKYSLIVALLVGNPDLRPIISELKSSIIPEVLASLKETEVPIEIALPQFTINSELDAKTILENLGVTRLWTDPQATRYISTPPALPSSYIQRATVTLNKDGVYLPPIAELRSHRPPSGPEETFFSEFKADRPFMFGLYDIETFTSLIASVYTQPTYPN
ncbi:hypothetical protein PYW07_010416 [Mythimna separata]|uniref:Serpin domain-containing protein n=1 Tax=Mythimna separata TaxID=271217 RepID=A0AAD7Y9W0_MYTSE|nr:hypothetical protein PYW07_010416 [Mythimna separata]